MFVLLKNGPFGIKLQSRNSPSESNFRGKMDLSESGFRGKGTCRKHAFHGRGGGGEVRIKNGTVCLNLLLTYLLRLNDIATQLLKANLRVQYCLSALFEMGA